MIGDINITHIRYTIRMLELCEMEIEGMIQDLEKNKKYNSLSYEFIRGAVLGMRNSLKVIRNKIRYEEGHKNDVGKS